jgi:HAD superfamily hydrolase (TIGR01549 family)
MVAAIVWDYDGTLVDSRQKNLRVTRAIIEEMTGTDPTTFSALQSLESYSYAIGRYSNWRDFYRKEFKLNDTETDDAGRKWTEFQMRDLTPTPVFEGIHDVVHRLRHVPHGIVSQSSRDAIKRVLEECDLMQYFQSLIGFEEVGLRRQKPEADGLLRCIDQLTGSPADFVLFIGDQETDTATARNGNRVLKENGSKLRIRSIGALYSSRQESSQWQIKPDHEARHVHDIIGIVESLNSMTFLHQ